MESGSVSPLQSIATTLFLRTRYSRHEGKSCRDYIIQDARGEQRFTARAFRVPGRITVYATAASDRPIVLAKPRRLFPLTGRYSVRAGDDDRLLGVITRSGRFYDARGRKLGRFQDARTWKDHVGEGIMTAVVEGVLAGDASAAVGPGPERYVITIGDAPAGTLARERVPFEVEAAPPAQPGRLVRALRSVLPKRVGNVLFERRPPHAWKLDVAEAAGAPDLLLLAATILAIEIALW